MAATEKTLAHPSQPITVSRRYPGFGLLFLVWTALGFFACVRNWLAVPGTSAATLPVLFGWLACYYAWLLLTLPIFMLESRFPLGLGARLRNLPVLILAGLGFACAAYQLNLLFSAALHFVFPAQPQPHLSWLIPAREYALEYALYGFVVISACIYRNLFDLRQKERLAARLALEKSQLEASLHQAQLETLRMRLNPHFLFNCLQNITTLTRQQPELAAQMLTRLGSLLRSALRRGSEPEATLAQELELIDEYLQIEQMRFPNRLTVLRDIDPRTRSTLVPVLLLQPIVENAILHGLAGCRQGALLHIRSTVTEGTLHLSVRDNGNGIGSRTLAEITLGTGLGSTCDRLERMYPGRHEISLHNLPEGGAEVAITLPFRPSHQSTARYEDPALIDRGR